MNDILDAAWDRNTRIENFAAELTSAVYPVVLRYGRQDQWLKLELGLWRALADTAKGWVQQMPSAASVDDLETWREGLLGALTGNVLCVALDHGIKGSVRDVEIRLHRAFHQFIRRSSRVN
jgi:hypothetical protein